MDGLFEDDANVRSQPKQKKKSKVKKKGVGSSIVKKVESKANIVASSAQGTFDFSSVNINPVKRGRKTTDTANVGKIIPPINYIEDNISDDDIQS